MQKKGMIISVAVFLVCLALGFWITNQLKPETEERQNKVTVQRTETLTDITVNEGWDTVEVTTVMRYDDIIVDGRDTIPGNGVLAEKKERIIGKYVEPQPKEEVTASQGESTNQKYAETTERKSVTQETVKQTKQETPIVEERPKPKPAKALMNKDEFKNLLLNTSDNTLEGLGSNKVSGSVKIYVSNLKPGENRPNRPAGVREKISTGTWKSVRVISIGTDAQTGKVTEATIEPVYE